MRASASCSTGDAIPAAETAPRRDRGRAAAPAPAARTAPRPSSCMSMDGSWRTHLRPVGAFGQFFWRSMSLPLRPRGCHGESGRRPRVSHGFVALEGRSAPPKRVTPRAPVATPPARRLHVLAVAASVGCASLIGVFWLGARAYERPGPSRQLVHRELRRGRLSRSRRLALSSSPSRSRRSLVPLRVALLEQRLDRPRCDGRVAARSPWRSSRALRTRRP